MERPLCDVKRKSSTGQEVGNENRARRRGKRADVRPERNQARKPMVKKGGEQLPFDDKLKTDGILSEVVSIEAHKQSAQNLILPPDRRNQLDQFNRVGAVHGTTVLEGNP